MEKTMIIVGSGIAGISTGCYARMNGYKTTILEMHSIPGGLCTAWKRKGYKFDISMHMLTGSKKGPVYKMWQELRVVQDQAFHYHDDIIRIESGDKSLNFCTDTHQLEKQMLELSPSDAELTKEFIRLINGRSSMGAMSLKPAEMTGFLDKLKTMVAILPSLGVFGKYGNQTIQEFAKRYKDPFLRDAVRFFIDSPGWPMLRFPMVAMAGFIKSAVLEAGVPLGGSQKVLFRMADYFKELGGEILYRNRVRDVIIEKDRAVGVGTEDGTEHLADIVVWADDGPANFGKFIAENLQNNNATVYVTEDNDELIAYILATIQYYPPVFEMKNSG